MAVSQISPPRGDHQNGTIRFDARGVLCRTQIVNCVPRPEGIRMNTPPSPRNALGTRKALAGEI